MSLRTESGPYFGDFGGRFVPESLIAALDELTAEYAIAKQDPAFAAELMELHRTRSTMCSARCCSPGASARPA
jgi:tryptophan synthase beta chain